ncbi:MAG: hypothetical protein LGB01_06915 [Sulfurovum sp.]|nr:hypothetical protein [Sulfurovum sp.]
MACSRRPKSAREPGSWIGEIEIPEAIMEHWGILPPMGKINPGAMQELMSLERAIKHNKGRSRRPHRLTHSTKLRDYLADRYTSTFFHSGERDSFGAWRFNHALKATVVGRSSGGFLCYPQHNFSS